jgi:hypothetical protein
MCLVTPGRFRKQVPIPMSCKGIPHKLNRKNYHYGFIAGVGRVEFIVTGAVVS